MAYKQLGLNSLRLPQTQSYRLSVIDSTVGYSHGHAAVADPVQGITEVIATGLRDALTNAASAKSAAKALKDAEQTALRNMRQTLRGLIKELSELISPVDRRWEAFGFNCPGDPQVPDLVENLTVTPGLPGTLMLAWDTAPRAAFGPLQRVKVNGRMIDV